MSNRKQLVLFGVLVFLVPFVTIYATRWYNNRVAALPDYGVVAIDSLSGSPGAFTDQQANRFSMESWKGNIAVVNFFFTHCPVVCPKMMKNMSDVEKELRGEKGLIFTSFSVDPEHDSATQLQHFADLFGIAYRDWKLVTGEKPVIYKLARNGFKLVASEGDGGPMDFIHSDKIILLDRQQQVDRQALHAGHGSDLLALVFAVEYEYRVDQVGRGNDIFAHHRAGESVLAHAAHADGGKLTGVQGVRHGGSKLIGNDSYKTF